MLRITVADGADATTVKLEGKLLRAWCAEVRRACRVAATTRAARPVRLDLADVDFIDADGVNLVRSLRAQDGVSVIQCSNFVAELLNTERV